MDYRSTVMVGFDQLDVVIVEELPGYWLSQVLQRDISQAGATPHEALEALALPISELVFNGKLLRPSELVEKAPKDYHIKHGTAVPLPPQA